MIPILCVMVIYYVAFGSLVAAVYIRDITGKDSWQNLHEHSKLTIKALIKWPLIVKHWFIYNTNPHI